MQYFNHWICYHLDDNEDCEHFLMDHEQFLMDYEQLPDGSYPALDFLDKWWPIATKVFSELPNNDEFEARN